MAQEYWLKAFGKGARVAQMRDDWRSITELTACATSRRRSSMKTGDRIVYYAAGSGVLFAAGTVTSRAYLKPRDSEDVWPWKVDVTLDDECSLDFIRHGVPLQTASVDGRDLGRSIRQKSHIRLTEKEHRAAIDALNAAVVRVNR